MVHDDEGAHHKSIDEIGVSRMCEGSGQGMTGHLWGRVGGGIGLVQGGACGKGLLAVSPQSLQMEFICGFKFQQNMNTFSIYLLLVIGIQNHP